MNDTTRIQTHRVYADPDGDTATDGFRVYIDRLWPRGESKARFHYDLWAKEIAPSDKLRHWFHDDPDNRWDEFRRLYLEELKANPHTPQLLEELRKHPLATLLYSSRDEQHNNAVVLASFLRDNL